MGKLRPIPKCFGNYDWYNIECHTCYWRGLCFMKTANKEAKKERKK